MKRLFVLPPLFASVWLLAQPGGDPLVEGFRSVEVASVSDAMEQLYGQRNYMSHQMRPLAKTKFVGPAVTGSGPSRSSRITTVSPGLAGVVEPG